MIEFMIPISIGRGQTLVNSVPPKSSKQMIPIHGYGEQNIVNSVPPDSKQLIKPLKDGVEQIQKNSLHTKSTLQLQEFKIPGQILTDQSKVKARDKQFPQGFKIGDGNAWPESVNHLQAQVQIDTVSETKPKTVQTFQTETEAAAADASSLPQFKLQHQQKAKPLPPRLPISNRTQATNQRSNEEKKDASEKYPEENQLNTSNSTKPNQSLRQGQRKPIKSQKTVQKQDGDESDQSCYISDIADNEVEVNEDDIFDEAFKKSIKDFEGQPLKQVRCRLQKLQEHIEVAKTAALLISMQPNLNMTHSEKANQIFLIEQQLKKLNSVRKKLVGNLVKLRGDEIYSPNDGQFTSVTDLMRKQLKKSDSVYYSSSDLDELEPQKIHDFFLMESFSFTDVQNVDLEMYRDLLQQCDIPVASVTRDKVKLTTILNRFVHVKVKSLSLQRDYLVNLHKFLELIYAQYSNEMHTAVKSANNHDQDEEKEVRQTKNHFLGLQSVTYFQRVKGFLWSENLQVIASSFLPDKKKNLFSTVNVQKLGRSKTTIFTTDVDVEGNVLSKTSYINETMGFFSNNARFVGMNLEKFVCCKSEAMQTVILKGKKTGIMKIAFTLNFQTSHEGMNHIKSVKNRIVLSNQLNMELTTIYRNLVRNDCLFTLPYDRLFATFFDSNFSQHPAFFVNAGNLAGIFYCFDEDRAGFIGKLVEVGTDFSHEEMQTRYAPDNRRNYLYDPSEDCLKLFQTDIIERAKFIVPLENKLNVLQKPTLMELVPNYIHLHVKKGIVYPDLKPMIGPKSQVTMQKRLKEQEKRQPAHQRQQELYDRGEVFWLCSSCKAVKNTSDYNRHNCKKRLNDPVPAVELTRLYPCPFPQCISKQSPRAMNLHVFTEHLEFYKNAVLNVTE